MNATSSWEKQARALEDAVTARPAPEAALPEYLRALDTVRRETMAAQPDDYLRQEAGILFEQAKQAGQLMTAVAAPKEEARPARKEKQLLSLVGMVAGFLACAAALLQCACYRLIDFPGDAQNQLVLRVLCYLDAHFAEPITNECIGRALHYHPNYLNAVFRQAVGLPLHRYLLQLRLQKAAAFLTAGNASVAQIAHDVGFENADHFSAAFTRQYGRAPTQYRSAHLI